MELQTQTADPLRLKVLVLNADFRALSTWPPSLIASTDALHAYYRDRVNIVESWEGAFLRSPSVKIKAPKVVALREYANTSASPKFCRRSIITRDAGRCQYCGEEFPSHELTFDHLVPRAKGGKTVWTNILTACVRCNALKKDQDANLSGRKGRISADGRLRPLKMPRQPTTAELLRNGLKFLSAEVRETWGHYLDPTSSAYWNVELER